VELLVVIAILALLLAVLFPSLNRAKEVARIALCKSQLRQEGIAYMNYAASNQGFLGGVVWGDIRESRTSAQADYSLPFSMVSNYNATPWGTSTDALPSYLTELRPVPGLRPLPFQKNAGE
jgi:type II secretory pathway pseudopilin PulG